MKTDIGDVIGEIPDWLVLDAGKFITATLPIWTLFDLSSDGPVAALYDDPGLVSGVGRWMRD